MCKPPHVLQELQLLKNYNNVYNIYIYIYQWNDLIYEK